MRLFRLMFLLLLLLTTIILAPNNLFAESFSVTFDWTNSFRIYGYQPVPQIYGFDYYFAPEQISSNLAGYTINIQNIAVSGYGNNHGNVINFDWEVHLSGSDINLPEGQFTKTLVDPVSGYNRTAETQYRFVIGERADSNSYLFQGGYDFTSNQGSAYPYLSTIKQATTQQMSLTDGLHAQLFLWTADNRNSQLQFDNLSLTVSGNATPPIVPEPISFILFVTGGTILWFIRLMKKG